MSSVTRLLYYSEPPEGYGDSVQSVTSHYDDSLDTVTLPDTVSIVADE